MSHSTLIVGQSLTDRWATFFIFKHHDDRVGMDLTFACACKTIMDFIMTDEEKQNDFRTRRNRFIYESDTMTSLIARARKKGRMREVIEHSLVHDHDVEEGTTFSIDAEVVGFNGTSVLMRLKAVAEQGVSALQYFSEEEFQKRFVIHEQHH